MATSKRAFKPGGWSSTLLTGAAAGAAFYPGAGPYGPAIAASSWVAGLALDYLQHKIADPHLLGEARNIFAIARKLRIDFRDSILHDRREVERARRLLLSRLIRARMTSSADSRFAFNDEMHDLWRWLALSQCWQGRPLQTSVDTVRAFGKITVSNVTIHAGLEAALQVMTEGFGLPLEAMERAANGVDQVLDFNKHADCDLAFLSDVNLLAAGQSGAALRFRHALPIFWQKQFLIEHADLARYEPRQLWFAEMSSAEEQLRLGSPVTDAFDAKSRFGLAMADVSHKAAHLNRGEAIIAWEPITFVSIRAGSGLRAREVGGYRLSTSVYFGDRIVNDAPDAVRFALLDCLIAAWNVAFLDPLLATIRLADRPDFRRTFRGASGG